MVFWEIDCHQLAKLSWGTFEKFLNSQFVSAFLSSLFGAGLGAWSAYKFAERSSRVKELKDSLRQFDAVAIFSVGVLNEALAMKKQYIKPLTEKYFKERVKAEQLHQKLLKGEAVKEEVIFEAELTQSASVATPSESIKNLILSSNSTSGKTLMLSLMLEQSIINYSNLNNMRNNLINDFQSKEFSTQDEFLQDYFGLKKKNGKTQRTYHDSMQGISQYLDDIIFFSSGNTP